MIRPFLVALQFLTRLPVRINGELDENTLGRSALYYPAVGLLLGLALATAAWTLQDEPALLCAALLVIMWVLITGALHLDGLADSADAWAGGQGARDKTLAIMKDPASGPMGVTAVALVLLVKLAALATLCEAGSFWGVAASPLLGRTAVPLLFLTTPYVRAGGLGHALAAQMPRRAAAVIVLTICISVAIFGDMLGWSMLLASAGVFLVFRRAIRQRLGGTTGDTAGALIELTEVATLLTAAAVV